MPYSNTPYIHTMSTLTEICDDLKTSAWTVCSAPTPDCHACLDKLRLPLSLGCPWATTDRAFKTFQDECEDNTSATLNVKTNTTSSSCNDQPDPGPDLTYCEQGMQSQNACAFYDGCVWLSSCAGHTCPTDPYDTPKEPCCCACPEDDDDVILIEVENQSR